MRARRTDLWAVAVWAAVAAGLLQFDSLPGSLRLLAGLPLVLALPGYALGYVLLGSRALGTAERVALSVALSLTMTILGTLVLDVLSLPLSRRTWSLFLGTITVAAAVAGDVGSSELRRDPRTWRVPRVRDAAAVGLALALAAAAVVLARTPLHPPRGVTGYTQLWVLPRGPGVEVGIASRELGPVRYRLDVSTGEDVERRWTQLRLEPGEQWTRVLSGRSLGRPGEAVTARLFRADQPRSAYRRVRLRLEPNGASAVAQRSTRTP
jgi:uncharacterized membrane protein